MSYRETSLSPHDGDRRRRRYHDDTRPSVSVRAETRSRSPTRRDSANSHAVYRSRRRDHVSPHQHPRVAGTSPVTLPLGATPLSKRDLSKYKSMFGTYLDIQKDIDIEELDERELRGRWKSFMGKWNRGELAEGWYDPSTFKKAVEGAYNREASPHQPAYRPRGRKSSSPYEGRGNLSFSTDEPRRQDNTALRDQNHTFAETRDKGRLVQEDDVDHDDDDEEEDGDSYGPQAPSSHLQTIAHKSGPKIPTLEDLTLKREEERLDLEEARRAERTSHKHELKSHKSRLREVEDEIAPRAEPGSRERMLEKKKEKATANRAFADRGGSPVDGVADADLMGGTEGNDNFKKLKESQTRKKNERELRKEEILRSRAEEREIRMRSYKRKEDETMNYLRAIAQERFG